MRFFVSPKSLKKFTGVAAALLILPVAVSCAGDPVEDTTAEITSEMPEGDAADPAVTGDIVDVAVANGSFDTLIAAVQAAGLEETLSSEGPYTLFAPTDEAFAALPEGTLDQLLLPENQEALTEILTYHVVEGAVPSTEIESGEVSTVEGEALDIAVDADGVMVNDMATVVQPDVVADNGIIHVIDTVLLPPTFDLASLAG
ncbi:MAG: fasciclin domain-containing protein [Phormidesmis sp.]